MKFEKNVYLNDLKNLKIINQKTYFNNVLLNSKNSKNFAWTRNLFTVGLLAICGYSYALNNYSRIDVSEEFFIDKKVLASAFGLEENVVKKNSLKGVSFDAKEILMKKEESFFADLKNNSSEYVVIVDKSNQLAKTYSLELKLIDTTLVSTGRSVGHKQKEGDLKTPNGLFKIVSKENSSDWVHDGKTGAYGKYFFRLDAGSWDANGAYNSDARSSIGLHGTSEPEKLGSIASEGCIRFSNEKNVEYANKGFLKKGTLVAIIDSDDYSKAVSSSELNLVSKSEINYDTNNKIISKISEFKPKQEVVYDGRKTKNN